MAHDYPADDLHIWFGPGQSLWSAVPAKPPHGVLRCQAELPDFTELDIYTGAEHALALHRNDRDIGESERLE
jgi:hypothetical protein